jgi:hypothetical protein
MATKQAPQGGFYAIIVISVIGIAGYWYYVNYFKDSTTNKILGIF